MGPEPVQLKRRLSQGNCLKEEDYSWVGEALTKQAKSMINVYSSVLWCLKVFEKLD